MRKVKIAQICKRYLPTLGGIQSYVWRLTRDFKKNGIDSTVLTTNLDVDSSNPECGAKYFKVDFSFLGNPYSKALSRHLEKESYQIIFLHSHWFIPSFQAALYKKKVKMITVIHGAYPDKSSVFLRTILFFYKPFAQYVLDRSDKVIVLSECEKEKLVGIFKIKKNKIIILPNGIDLENYAHREKEKVILFTGRIVADKNPLILIKACAILQNKIKNFKFIFVGEIKRNYKQKLVKLASKLGLEKAIEFAGPFGLGQKYKLLEFYQRAAIFVSIGSWEGLPTRLLEAMQFEIPCITYSKNGLSDIIVDRQNGVIINKLDEKLLSEKLCELFSNREFAEKLGKEARKTVVSSYDWKDIFKKILLICDL